MLFPAQSALKAMGLDCADNFIKARDVLTLHEVLCAPPPHSPLPRRPPPGIKNLPGGDGGTALGVLKYSLRAIALISRSFTAVEKA